MDSWMQNNTNGSMDLGRHYNRSLGPGAFDPVDGNGLSEIQ